MLLSAWAIVAFYLVQFVLARALLWLLQFLEIFNYNSLSRELQGVVGVALVYSLTLVVVVAVPWILFHYATTKKELGLDRLLGWSDLALGPVAFVPYIILTTILSVVATNLFPGFDAKQVQELGIQTVTNGTGMAMAFIALVVIAPLAEEILFRGYMYGKVKSYIGMIPAVLLVSVCFGAVHGQWNVALDVFALSIVLCGLRELTGSIWAGVVLHMAKNGLAFAALFTFIF